MKSAGTSIVCLAVREVPRRFMGPRTEPKFEAELRERVKDKYVTRGHVARTTRAEAIDAARALAKRRGWQIDETKRPSWHTRDATLEQAIAEEAREAPAIAEAAEVLEQAPAIAETAVQPEGEAAQIVRWMRATFGHRIRKEVYDAIERGDWRKHGKRAVR